MSVHHLYSDRSREGSGPLKPPMSFGQHVKWGLLLLAIAFGIVLVIAFVAPSITPARERGIEFTSHANKALENYIYQGRFQR